MNYSFKFLAGLGEFRIRDLNDEINKLLREKRHWENQISALGGPHYRRYGPKMFDTEGREVPGNRGYKYFGAAKDLPGVRELFEQVPRIRFMRMQCLLNSISISILTGTATTTKKNSWRTHERR